MELPHETRGEPKAGARPIEKSPYGDNRKARRAQAADDRRFGRKVRKAIAGIELVMRRG